jgi:hypothetical protein
VARSFAVVFWLTIPDHPAAATTLFRKKVIQL